MATENKKPAADPAPKQEDKPQQNKFDAKIEYFKQFGGKPGLNPFFAINKVNDLRAKYDKATDVEAKKAILADLEAIKESEDTIKV